MNEIKKLYEAWCEERFSDTPEVNEKWCKVLEYLFENCPDSVSEDIATLVMDFCDLAEQEAFIAGFQQAFRIWSDIL